MKNISHKELENKLWQNALRLMPRGTQTMSKCPDQFVDGVYPKFMERGFGAYLYDLQGNEYLDYMCGLGPVILGYNNAVVNDAILEQLKSGITLSWPTLLEQELAQLIVNVVPSAEQVRFGKNGTDVCLAAVRIARSYTKKEKILKPKGGYHGWGDWHAITLRDYGVPKCLKDCIDEFEYNDLDSLEQLLAKKDVAAVIMEPQALTKPNKEYLQGVRDLCTKYEVILIFDEIVSGFRWALGGAQEYYGVIPDLTCLGKAMANGMPLSAICGKEKYMQEMNHIFFSMTFGGECLSLAASIATINELRKKDYSTLWRLGDMLKGGIQYEAKTRNLNINMAGSAPRQNLTFQSGYDDSSGMKDLFFQEMVKQNILFPNVIYVQFSHNTSDIEHTIWAAANAFNIVKDNIDSVDNVLEGKRSVSVFRKNT